MARTPSNMLPLGTQVPDFTLLNTLSNEQVSFQSISGDKPTLVMFICNHCPFVIHLHEGFQKLYKDYQGQINFVAISSNDALNYPDDRPELMGELFNHLSLDFPYLYDENQSIAQLFDAACTPDFYLLDDSNKLIYRGQFDGSRPGNDIPVTGNDLRLAVDVALIGIVLLDNQQKPSLGCNIKWK
ncbi:thioredoxin family protein [Cyclobacteriaceae bacterium]|nr:thioredoxin family protein [Cyclobacteriaceae bacterium]